MSFDFGGSSVKYAVVEKDGTMHDVGHCAPPLDDKETFVSCVRRIVMEHDDVEGIAISIPGYVNAESGVLTGSGAYRALYGCNMIELLQSRIALPIAVENDGKCGALAEAAHGALKNCRDGVVLILGSGVAGGVIKDGRIHAGRDLAAGEFSNYIVEPNNPSFLGLAVMHCAAFGLTYRLCKAKHLDFACQDLSQELKNVDAAFGDKVEPTRLPLQKIRADGRQLAKWLAEKDPVAVKIYSDFLNTLAFMIVNIQITYAPEKIVIGGGLSRLEGMLEDLQKAVDVYYDGAGFVKELRATIVRSAYLDECNLVGAASNFYSRHTTK